MPNENFRIHTMADHILVKFEADFDHNVIRDVLLKESQMPEALYMNESSR